MFSFLSKSPGGHVIYRRNEEVLQMHLSPPNDICQQMPDFDSCQFIFIRMAYIMTGYCQFVQDLMWHLTSAYIWCTYGQAYADVDQIFSDA